MPMEIESIFDSIKTLETEKKTQQATGDLTTRDVANFFGLTIYRARYLLLKLEAAGCLKKQVSEQQKKNRGCWVIIHD